MSKSIVTDDMEHCFFCGKPRECVHHIIGGHGRRAISEREGFKIPLCNYHHNMGDNEHCVHGNKKIDLRLRKLCQKKYEELGHSREEFIRLIGRNYLGDDE